MSKKRTIFDAIFTTILVAIIVVSLIFATGALFNAQFVINLEVMIQKRFALYDFDIVKVSTIVAICSVIILIIGLIIEDNKTKVKKKKIVRR